MLSTATRDAVTDLVEHIRPNHPYPDLLDRWSIHLDTQVETIGKKQKGSNLKEDSSGNVWHDVRIPEKFGPYALDFDLLAKATRIGASGWNYHTFQSEWVGIDIDGKDHGPKGNTREILDQIVHKASPLSYVEVRRSTGGSGLHLYTRLEGFPSYTREDHAKLAQLVVAKMEADMGFPLSDHLDCVGSIMWLWARDLKEGSLAPISESTETLTPEDLPEWSESAETEDPGSDPKACQAC